MLSEGDTRRALRWDASRRLVLWSHSLCPAGNIQCIVYTVHLFVNIDNLELLKLIIDYKLHKD